MSYSLVSFVIAEFFIGQFLGVPSDYTMKI